MVFLVVPPFSSEEYLMHSAVDRSSCFTCFRVNMPRAPDGSDKFVGAARGLVLGEYVMLARRVQRPDTGALMQSLPLAL